MIEIQCTSCHTRYRIDERVLPDETPTFKCSRCGHVFNAEPVAARPRKPPVRAVEKPRSEATPPPMERDPEPEPEARPEPPVETRQQPEPAPEPVAEETVHSSEAPARAAEPEENPLDRTFSREQPEDMTAGENLSFDFASEPNPGAGQSEAEGDNEEHQTHSDDHWEVGEAPEDTPGQRETIRHEMPPEPEPPARPVFKSPPPPRVVRREPAGEEFDRPQFSAPRPEPEEAPHAPLPGAEIPEEVAYFAASKPAHSAVWFLGLFALIAGIFATASLAIHMEPAAAARMLSQAPRVGSNFQRPMVPATLVALHDVHADYQQVKGGQNALLISGTAENVGGTPLHAVLLAVDLLDDSGKQMASVAAFCGNGLTTRMVGEMTPREIEFLQRLDPQKNFAVDPSHSTPFLLVFIDPPRKIANLRIQVAKAVAPAAAAPKS